MSCLAYWGVLDYMEVVVLSRDFAGFEKWWLGESLRSRNSWKTLALLIFLGMEPKNLSKTDVVHRIHGFQTMWLGAPNSGKTLVLAKFFNFHKIHGFQSMWLGAPNSRITLVLPMFLKGGARKHRQNQCFP